MVTFKTSKKVFRLQITTKNSQSKRQNPKKKTEVAIEVNFLKS